MREREIRQRMPMIGRCSPYVWGEGGGLFSVIDISTPLCQKGIIKSC